MVSGRILDLEKCDRFSEYGTAVEVRDFDSSLENLKDQAAALEKHSENHPWGPEYVRNGHTEKKNKINGHTGGL